MHADYLKTYKVILETKGPLYIGSGREINKKEYIYDKGRKEIIIPDLYKMYNALMEKRLEKEYEKYMLDNKTKDLFVWLKRHNISRKQYSEWKKYVLDCTDADLESRGNHISEFVKDAYGNPYIPGSSLKGALRTILLADCLNYNEIIKKQAVSFIKQGQRKSRPGRKYLQEEERKIESSAFCTLGLKNATDAANDEMKGIIVSDSKALNDSDLVLCQKVDVNVKGNATRLSILRECIKPGTQIEFMLTIDETICQYTDDTILDAIYSFYKKYQLYLCKFGETENEQDIIYLGGSAGFVTKTIIYQIFPKKEAVNIISNIFDKTLSKKARAEHKHHRDIELGVSPHVKKCTYYAGKLLEFGKCKIYIEEV